MYKCPLTTFVDAIYVVEITLLAILLYSVYRLLLALVKSIRVKDRCSIVVNALLFMVGVAVLFSVYFSLGLSKIVAGLI